MQVVRPDGTNRKLLVETLEKLRQEDASSHVADIVESQLLHQAVLKRTLDSFHVALGLAGVRR
jgi:hypothetical protein